MSESDHIKDHKEIIETLGGAELEAKTAPYTPKCATLEKDKKDEFKVEKPRDDVKE